MAEPPEKPKLRVVPDAADADATKPSDPRAPTTAKGEREAYKSFLGQVRDRKGDFVDETSVYGTGADGIFN